MGRPPTNPTKLKDGYYLEIRNIGSKTGIKIRRDNETEMNNAKQQYERSKTVIVLGEYKDGKPINGKGKGKVESISAFKKAVKKAAAEAAKQKKAPDRPAKAEKAKATKASSSKKKEEPAKKAPAKKKVEAKKAAPKKPAKKKAAPKKK